MQDLLSADTSDTSQRSRAAAVHRADFTAPTRRHKLDHAVHTDHADHVDHADHNYARPETSTTLSPNIGAFFTECWYTNAPYSQGRW